MDHPDKAAKIEGYDALLVVASSLKAVGKSAPYHDALHHLVKVGRLEDVPQHFANNCLRRWTLPLLRVLHLLHQNMYQAKRWFPLFIFLST